MTRDSVESQLLAYLYASIVDIQSTIRVIDTKIAIVLGVLVFPLTNLGKIYVNFAKLYKTTDCGNGQWLLWILVCAFYITWLLAFVASVRAIMAIHNPVLHINGSNFPNGTFYNGCQFKTNLFDVYFTRKIKSSSTLDNYLTTFPKNIEEIKAELCFEQMKLTYIRDIKSIRLKWAYLFLVIWLVCGFISRMLYLYHCSS